jgi:hypothetical protein
VAGRRHETVSHASHGQNHLGVVPIIAKPLTKPLNMHGDSVRAGLSAPYSLKYLLTADNAPSVCHEHLQEPKLSHRHPDNVSVQPDLKQARVKPQRPTLQHRLKRGYAVGTDGPQDRHEFT